MGEDGDVAGLLWLGQILKGDFGPMQDSVFGEHDAQADSAMTPNMHSSDSDSKQMFGVNRIWLR